MISNIRRYSRTVDEIADMIRLTRETHAAETVTAITGLFKNLFQGNQSPMFYDTLRSEHEVLWKITRGRGFEKSSPAQIEGIQVGLPRLLINAEI